MRSVTDDCRDWHDGRRERPGQHRLPACFLSLRVVDLALRMHHGLPIGIVDLGVAG